MRYITDLQIIYYPVLLEQINAEVMWGYLWSLWIYKLVSAQSLQPLFRLNSQYKIIKMKVVFLQTCESSRQHRESVWAAHTAALRVRTLLNFNS